MMVNRLPVWLFLSLAMLLMGFAQVPLIRALLGVRETVEMPFLTVVSLLIAGLMCGLTAMLLLTRRQPNLKSYLSAQQYDAKTALALHLSGFALYTGIPLANFLLCYYLWVKNRHKSLEIDRHGREAICFQITIYLYLMMCLFMAYIIVGAFAIPLVLSFHALSTLTAAVFASRGKTFRYPANISIIDRLQD